MTRWRLLSITIAFLVSAAIYPAQLRVPQDYVDVRTAIASAQQCDTICLDSGNYSGPGFREIVFGPHQCIKIASKYGAGSTRINLGESYFCKGEVYAGQSPYYVAIVGIHFINGVPAVEFGYDNEILVIDCVFSNCKVAIQAGDYSGSTNGGVYGCSFQMNDTAVRGVGDPWLQIGYCEFFKNRIAVLGRSAPWYSIYNSVFVNNQEAGYYVIGENRSLIENSVFCGNAFGVIAYDSPYNWDGRLICCNVYGNWWENYSGVPDQTGSNGNISSDPHFCDTSTLNLTISSISPLLAGNNTCHQLIGNAAIVACYCGDVDVSGNVDISDITAIIGYLYLNGPAPNPLAAGEIDGISPIDIADLTSLIDYLYVSFLPLPCGL